MTKTKDYYGLVQSTIEDALPFVLNQEELLEKYLEEQPPLLQSFSEETKNYIMAIFADKIDPKNNVITIKGTREIIAAINNVYQQQKQRLDYNTHLLKYSRYRLEEGSFGLPLFKKLQQNRYRKIYHKNIRLYYTACISLCLVSEHDEFKVKNPLL
jgi:hypothetical protein